MRRDIAKVCNSPRAIMDKKTKEDGTSDCLCWLYPQQPSMPVSGVEVNGNILIFNAQVWWLPDSTFIISFWNNTGILIGLKLRLVSIWNNCLDLVNTMIFVLLTSDRSNSIEIYSVFDVFIDGAAVFWFRPCDNQHTAILSNLIAQTIGPFVKILLIDYLKSG